MLRHPSILPIRIFNRKSQIKNRKSSYGISSTILPRVWPDMMSTHARLAS
jgi:hypothetical protein